MIIVSITGPRMSDALAQVAASARFADAFEFRLDLIRSPELAVLMLCTAKPVIATCRPVWEEGEYRGGEHERMELLSAASLLGADYIDLELRTERKYLRSFLGRRSDTRVILSHHVASGKHFSASSVYTRMKPFNADIMKFAFHAQDAWENRLAFDFLHFARRDGNRAVAIAIGEAGEPSRILYRVFGGWGTYAAAEEGPAAGPGQVTARTLREIYHADRLNAATRIFGVVGNPTAQSKGVFVHNPLFSLAGKNAVYCRFRTVNLRHFVKSLSPLIRGFSVTQPHKKDIMRYLTSVDPVAKAIGAVNTVLRRRGGMWGTNTDAPGALDAIERVVPVDGKIVLIAGAGGAARAIAFEAKRRGASVVIANRTLSRARRLAREFGVRYVAVRRIGEVKFDILVNATSVGMMPRPHASPVPARLLKGKVVVESVYNPPLTKLLRDATEAGARIVPGTAMYVNQGARQFHLYAGVPPDIRMMKRLLSEHRG